MDRSFPVILSNLRKEKGMSQKEAAAKLGISQALLSHYEKGIRECGQSFLIKVADFYGVSCDYLLGRTKERNELDIIANEILSDNSSSDSNPTRKTFIKAGTLLTQLIKDLENGGSMKLDMLYAIALYKIILIQAKAGNLPKNWCGRAYVNGEVCCNSMYLGIAELAAYKAIIPNKNKKPVPEMPVPEAIKTLVAEAEDFIVKAATEQCPPVPFEFLK
ncbi:MAG: helix-turn-helix transcriptional regulator [Clostridia bacterium]|nr:helix-turn-helix transcriptional regulator [Clostridia bacterium]